MQRQRNPRTPQIISISPLSRDDLQWLQAKSNVPALQRLRESHRMLIRYLAMGLSNNAIAEELGMSYSRVSILSHDPTIQDEVAKLRKAIDGQTLAKVDVAMSYMHKMGMKALSQINDRLDAAEEPGAEPIPLRELRGISELSMDRIGYGKKTTNLNVNVDFAAKLEAARSRSRSVPVIDVEAIPEEAA